MRFKHFLFFIVFISCSVLSQAQNILVKTEWDPKDLETKISVNDLVLMDNADRALKLDVSFTYPERRLLKPLDFIFFEFRSFSPELKYLDENNRGFAIVADGERIDLGALKQSTYRADVKGRKVISYHLSWPKVDSTPILDKSGKPIRKAFLELLSAKIDLKQFLKVAQADRIELVLGNDVFSFPEAQISAIRKLANRATP